MDTPARFEYKLSCANFQTCNGVGIFPCIRGCALVAYCSVICEESHWPEHRKDCEALLAKDGWRPAYEKEGRKASWVDWDSAVAPPPPLPLLEDKKLLWSGTLAADILNVEDNEALDDDSGDLRHLVRTIAELPPRAHWLLAATINIEWIALLPRNVILLLCALDATQSAQGHDQAYMSRTIDTMIHVWYSAFWTRDIVQYLEEKIQPLLEQVRHKLDGKARDTVIDHTWNFPGGSSIHLSLPVVRWNNVIDTLKITPTLNHQIARDRMQHATLDPRRRDAREYHYSKMTDSPHLRVAYQRFLEDGMLLPFGHSRLDFVCPNRAMFPEVIKHDYTEFASPLAAWGIVDVDKTPWVAENDLYGKLYCFLGDVIGNFLDCLGQTRIVLSLLNVTIRALPHRLGSRKYDRIEVSNVCGREGLSIRDTFQLFSGHLMDPTDNPHATLMTWFVNAAKEPKDVRGNAQRLLTAFQLPLLYNIFDAKVAATQQPFTLVDAPRVVDNYFAELSSPPHSIDRLYLTS
ncbi:hypothetical protein THARTR1_02680 [Trichoderma harzianum]|uniref:MYND-type domain-containing protein n=1 Tax=Trichoderma harzianum TaxID=5544 RepID=A0A2K0UIQ5_TRIHA|nr:hypothetical protein THARTR1_02680 [Trichoderma harzianum]